MSLDFPALATPRIDLHQSITVKVAMICSDEHLNRQNFVKARVLDVSSHSSGSSGQ